MKILMIFFMFFQPPIKHTWGGKEVTNKQFQDSTKVFYFKFIDSFNRIDQKKWLDSAVFNNKKTK
jgi:hypothetical protein